MQSFRNSSLIQYKFLVVSFFCLFSHFTFAGKVPSTRNHLVDITTDQDKSLLYKLSIELDKNDRIIKIHNQAKKKLYSYDAQQLNDKIVIYKTSGKEIVTLSSPNFDPQYGGIIKLTHLRNAISNLKGHFYMRLENVDNRWVLLADKNSGKHETLIYSLFLKTNKFYGKVIGIDKVIANRNNFTKELLHFFQVETFEI